VVETSPRIGNVVVKENKTALGKKMVGNPKSEDENQLRSQSEENLEPQIYD
jgi:hypothetical protein